MSDLRSVFTSRDFIINSNIVKCISKIDITLKEFLLVIYFINISSYLNNDDIKEKLGFDDEELSNIFASLLDKKYIEIEVSSNNGVVMEKVKLDPLYDRLALNQKVNNVDSDIFSIFESEFGRTLSPMEYDIVNEWKEKGFKDDIIIAALNEAIYNGVTNTRYINTILYEWRKKGINEVSDIKIKNKKETKKELFEYDWLNEDE